MGEKQTVQIAKRLDSGEDISTMHDILGTCYTCPTYETPYDGVEVPSFDNVLNSKRNMQNLAELSKMSRTIFVVDLLSKNTAK